MSDGTLRGPERIALADQALSGKEDALALVGDDLADHVRGQSMHRERVRHGAHETRVIVISDLL